MKVSKAISTKRSIRPSVVIIFLKVPGCGLSLPLYNTYSIICFFDLFGERDLVRWGTEDKPDGH